jgi:hypothetical protein
MVMADLAFSREKSGKIFVPISIVAENFMK